MSRLAPLDRALVLLVLPLWLVDFGFAVRLQLAGGGGAYVGVTSDADGALVLNGEYSNLYRSDPLARAGLRAGDRLVRVGDTDLQDASALAFHAHALRAAAPGSQARLVYERDGERRETSLGLVPTARTRPWLAASLAFAAAGLFLLLRARPTPTVRACSRASLCVAFATCIGAGGRWEIYAASMWLWMIAWGLVFPLLLRFAYLFPDDRAPEGRLYRIWPLAFVVLLPFYAAGIVGGNYAFSNVAAAGTVALGCAAVVAVVTAKYRRGDPVARRQIRWVMVGAYAGFLPAVAITAVAAVAPALGALMPVAAWALAVFPAFLLVSIVRFNLFDVDRILSATASYNILAVLLGAGVLIGVPRAARAVSGIVGIDPEAGQIAFSVALVLIVIPAHRWLRPQIDRVFFKERYALDRGIAELLPALSACRDARELTECAGEELQRLLRPDACVAYARVDESYVPVFAAGRAVPPAFAVGSPLTEALRSRRGPLSLSEAGRRPDRAPLGAHDRAALQALNAEVVVPVRQGEGLAAFLCLGPRRSGDVYTPTDLSLLAAVAEKVAAELRRFDQEEVIREGRRMQERLRRYVPGAVVEQLAGGGELASGEREVSVLFVDIRGYMSFSESRRAEEIFSTVNRYTETVSQIVKRHAGSVVEFNGDGMMAVFGAPRDITHKERSAVVAGREIVAAVAQLPLPQGVDGDRSPTAQAAGERGPERGLSVGVGIATGPAFVGNIRAVDRMIWSAIGNTTNLAARLQGLTRELDASVVIDVDTWERARPAADDFEKWHDVPIRGRRESHDLYALPQRGTA